MPDRVCGGWARQVESLTAARKGALSGNEPSDAIRVVNALLTQIDKASPRRRRGVPRGPSCTARVP